MANVDGGVHYLRSKIYTIAQIDSSIVYTVKIGSFLFFCDCLGIYVILNNVKMERNLAIPCDKSIG